MTTIRTIIADDHPDSLEIIDIFVKQHYQFIVVAKCKDGEELLQNVVKHNPDLIITDINMPKLNGMDAIKKSKVHCPNLNFIFVTGYDDYALEAFKECAIDYIVKPIDLGRFTIALEKAKAIITHLSSKSKSKPISSKLKVKSNGSIYFISPNDIYYIEKQGKKCLIHVKEKTYEINETISELCKRLDSTFYLSHRSNIINLKKISHITSSNETYLAYFDEIKKQAHISKLKIKEVEKRIQQL